MNSNFITLVPKKDRSVKVGDFHPISLVTSVYKITTMVLSIRLGDVLSYTISHSQSAFVSQIVDAALLVNGICR